MASKLLKKSHVLTLAEFTGKQEADIEDMFDESFYVELLNGEFSESLFRRLGTWLSNGAAVLLQLLLAAVALLGASGV